MINLEANMTKRTLSAFAVAAGLGLAGIGISTSAVVRLVGKPAPELANDNWIHSAPLRLEDLRGTVVLLEFWTYG